MRKLVVLMLVLGVASLANAAIMSSMEIVKTGANTYGINLPNGMSSVTDAPSGGYWVLLGVDPASGALAATKPASMDLSVIYGDADIAGYPTGQGVFGEFTASSTVAWTAAAGIYADGFTAQPGVNVLQLFAVADDLSGATFKSEFLVPEPATLAILGLGGLLLRRKK